MNYTWHRNLNLDFSWLRLFFPRRLLAFVIVSIICAACASSDSGRKKTEKTAVEKRNSADIYVKLGFEYMGRDQNEIALKNFKQALQIDDKNTDAHHAIAVFYQKLDRIDLADLHFKRAVELQPSNARAHNNYGKLLCSEGDFEKAQEHLKLAYTESSNVRPWIALSNAGRCAQLKGDIGAAESYLHQALKQNRAYAPALLGMAEISFNNKDYLSALWYFLQG